MFAKHTEIAGNPVPFSPGVQNEDGQPFGGGTLPESATVSFDPTFGTVAEDNPGTTPIVVVLSISDENGGDGLDDAVSGTVVVNTGDPTDVTFTGTFDVPVGTADGATRTIDVSPVDDDVYEGDRVLTFGFGDLVNTSASGSFELAITEDEPVPSSALILTGVIEGDRAGGAPKAVEIYVVDDVADLSVYGLGTANNGGGSDGVEFTFPADAASAGDFLYVATEATEFAAFFGFAPDYTDGNATAVSGDDVVELFLNGAPVDVFGDVNTDGSGEPWEYTNGWAYRESGTGPDGASFTLGHWAFSGTGALTGVETNDAAATPFPVGSYDRSGAEVFDGPGWRLLAAPGGGVTVADLADVNLVQGVTGEYPAASDTLFLDYGGGGTGTYGAATSASDDVPAGKGFLWYWYDEAFGPFDEGTSQSRELSGFTLPLIGTEQTADVTVTRTRNDGDNFYMLGNPFQQAFDVAGISSSNTTLSASFLVYDPELGLGSTGLTSGGYIEVTDGDLIAVWQGVFAQVTAYSTAGDPSFTYAAASRSPSATPVIYAREAPRPTTVALMLTGEGTGADGAPVPVVDAVTKARFRDGATPAFDRYDLSELAPPNAASALLAFSAERDGEPTRLGIHSLPATLSGPVVLPVEFSTSAAGTFDVAGELVSVPEGWTASLRDLQTGSIADLTAGETLAFSADAPTVWASRFELVVSPGASVAGESEADGFALGLATPNPAAASAALALRVGAPQRVTATVYDALGRAVQTAFTGDVAPSTGVTITVDTAALAPSTYLVRVEGETFAQSRRLTVVR